MGGLGIPTLIMIMPGAYMSSLITTTHNIQLHSPRLHKQLMKSIINNDQFYAWFYDQVMEHHDWFDGSDERGEPVYFLPAPSRRRSISTLTSTFESNTGYSQLRNGASVK